MLFKIVKKSNGYSVHGHDINLHGLPTLEDCVEIIKIRKHPIFMREFSIRQNHYVFLITTFE